MDEEIKRIKDGGSNQKLILFKRGKAMSQAPIIRGTITLPKVRVKPFSKQIIKFSF
jgi:hypothetical protein